jgi:hypothetical protein
MKLGLYLRLLVRTWSPYCKDISILAKEMKKEKKKKKNRGSSSVVGGEVRGYVAK